MTLRSGGVPFGRICYKQGYPIQFWKTTCSSYLKIWRHWKLSNNIQKTIVVWIQEHCQLLWRPERLWRVIWCDPCMRGKTTPHTPRLVWEGTEIQEGCIYCKSDRQRHVRRWRWQPDCRERFDNGGRSHVWSHMGAMWWRLETIVWHVKGDI